MFIVVYKNGLGNRSVLQTNDYPNPAMETQVFDVKEDAENALLDFVDDIEDVDERIRVKGSATIYQLKEVN